MSERTHDPVSGSGDVGREVQRLHGEINELKSEMSGEFERINEGLGKIQLALPEKKTYATVEEKAQAYWKRNITFILQLLAVWALVSYVCGILLANADLGTIGVLPFSFWFAQQGSIIVFIVLIWIYARHMDKVDREFDVHE